MNKISVVVPCYNEAQNIPVLHEKLVEACNDHDFEIVFVNDGSTDDTVSVVAALKRQDSRVKLISLLRNAGHQAALRAGLRHAQGEYIISMDADLQHPPEQVPAMIAKAQEGFEVVAMVYDEKQRGMLKNLFSAGFYRLFSIMSGVKIDPRASDFRLVSRRVQQVINGLPEHNLFLRAIIPSLGVPYISVKFRLAPRHRGRPGYTFGKSLFVAVEALFAFSTMPIRMMFAVGCTTAAMAFVYGLVNVGFRVFTERNVPGYTDIIASVLFLGGLNLAMLSVIGKYLQVVLDHVKQRPEYLIDSTKSDYTDPSDR